MSYKATGLSLTFHAIEWECAFSSLCSIVVSEKSIVVVCQVLPLYCSMSITPQLHCYYYYSLTQSRKFNGVKLIENISLKCQTRLSSQAILASSYSRQIRKNAFSLKLKVFELLNPRLSLSISYNTNSSSILSRSQISKPTSNMSSLTSSMPVVTLYPSHKEIVNSYMASIRLASSIRNSMDAQKAGQKAGVVGERAPVNADSYARHRPNFPPNGGRNADTAYNKTSSAHSTVDTTQSGSVPSQDRYPSSSQSMSTGICPLVEIHPSAAATNLSTLAYTSIDATIESRMRHHGNRPPPDAPMGTATLEDRAAHIPTGLKPEGLGQHHESFPPPEPPIGATQAPPF